MASSVDAIVAGLEALLQQGLNQAAGQAGRLGDILTEAINDAQQEAGQIAELPQQLLDKLKQAAADPKDWLSLMIMAALQLQKLVGPQLKVGAWDPGDNWSRALILTYTQPLPAGQSAELSLSIALGQATNGFIIATHDGPQLTKAEEPLELSFSGTGDVEFRIPIGGAPTLKQGAGSVTAQLTLTRAILPQTDPSFGVSVGKPSVGGQIAAAANTPIAWSAKAWFGAPGQPGLGAKVDLTSFLGDLAKVIAVSPVDESYSPSLTIASGGGAPVFDLGRAST